MQVSFISDKRQHMPYVVKLYLYLFVGGIVAVVVALWLVPLGLVVNLIFAFSAAYLWIIFGRWLFGRPGGL